VIVQSGDLTRAADVEALLAATLREFGGVDLLVANAGAFQRTPLASLSEAQWDAMLGANLRTTFLCARSFGLQMQSQKRGCIIALADVAALRPWAEYLAYNVAKAGVVALVQTLAKELAPHVRVNAVAPGPVLFPPGYPADLRQREIDRTLLHHEGHPQHVASAILALATNDYITGVVLPVDGGRSLR
jgi:pteridine reductase